jgi:hypothetical protein
MSDPIRDKLINMALTRVQTTGSRNKAGYWLGQQLHYHDYSLSDAEPVILKYQAIVENQGSDPYTANSAKASLKQAFRETKRPGFLTPGNSPIAWKARKTRPALATAPPIRHEPEPNPESVAGFHRQFNDVEEYIDSPAAVYLGSRGIPEEIAIPTPCGYAPNWGKIGQAVIFPIRNEEGEYIAAHGRSVTDGQKQTFGPMSLGVFCTPGALDADPVAIVEAPIDALSLALVGLPAIALCGIRGIPLWLIDKLAAPITPGRSRIVFLAFDADDAGDTASGKTTPVLYLVKAVRLRPEGGKDWNAVLMGMGADCLREYIGTAIAEQEPTIYPSSQTTYQESQPEKETKHPCKVCGRSCFLVPIPNTNKYDYHCTCGNTARILDPRLKQSKSTPLSAQISPP